MAIKKTLIVNLVRQGRKRWQLTLQSTDSNLLAELRQAIYVLTEKHDVFILNAADPFGIEVPHASPKTKKVRKLRSDKGTRRAADTADTDNLSLIGSSHGKP